VACAKISTKKVYGFIEVILHLIGCALGGGKLATELLDSVVDSRYFILWFDGRKYRKTIKGEPG